MTHTPFDCPAIRELSGFVREADAAKAAHIAAVKRWSELHTAAKAALEAAEAAFLVSLDAPAAAALADASDTLRKVSIAAAVVEKAGDPEALRQKSLARAEVFAALSAGYADRQAALVGLKKAANDFYLLRIADVMEETGVADLLAIEASGRVRDARDLVDRIEGDAQTALVARNYAKVCGVGCAPRPFDELHALLAAPLPVIPDAPAAAVPTKNKAARW